mmetsp:Transcript_8613/g.15090  ORF Transcript_8613/g.15090 Transcript_8613/m.15090 type:complete len:98 (-) Transcript_8613:432-725(-)
MLVVGPKLCSYILLRNSVPQATHCLVGLLCKRVKFGVTSTSQRDRVSTKALFPRSSLLHEQLWGTSNRFQAFLNFPVLLLPLLNKSAFMKQSICLGT